MSNSTPAIPLAAAPPAQTFGIVAEFADPASLLHAAEAVRKAGFRKFDVHSPFPIHGMNEAMGIRRSLVPWIVLCGGLAGGSGALLLQWWVHTRAYPLVISGKPLFSVPAFIPVVFELTVLLSAFAALFGMLGLNMLPMHYHPLLKSDRFAIATSHGFFISIEARDAKFGSDTTRRLLESLGASHIELLEA